MPIFKSNSSFMAAEGTVFDVFRVMGYKLGDRVHQLRYISDLSGVCALFVGIL